MDTVQHVPGLLSHIISFLVGQPPHTNYHMDLCELQTVNKHFQAGVVNLPGYLTRVHLKLRKTGHDLLGVVDASRGKLVELRLGDAWEPYSYHTFTDKHLQYLAMYTPRLGILRLHMKTNFSTKGLECLNRIPSLTHISMPMGKVRWPSFHHITWISIFGNVSPASVTSKFIHSAVSKNVTSLCINRLRRVTAGNMETFARVFPNIHCLRLFDCSAIKSYDPLIFNSNIVLDWVRNLTTFTTIHSNLLPIAYTAFSRTYNRVFPNVSHFGADDRTMSPVETCPLCKCLDTTSRVIFRRCDECISTSFPALKVIILFRC